MIEVPATFVRTTVDREGEPGARWLAGLPALLGELTDRWDCVPDGDAVHGGVGIVVPVTVRATGLPAVLKVSYPHPGNDHEPDAFTAWRGHGAVRLYARDDARYAMLLERVRSESLAQDVEEIGEIARVAGGIARRLAVPVPEGTPPLPRLADLVARWAEELRADRREFAGALPDRTVDAALATARELGPSQPELLVHGDLHARNVLRAEREPWLAVDPKGWVGDPAFDAGTLLKPLALRLLAPGTGETTALRTAHRVLDVFSEAAGFDRERAGRWAHFQVVRACFWGRRHGFRIARGGARLDTVTRLADRFAELLTMPTAGTTPPPGPRSRA